MQLRWSDAVDDAELVERFGSPGDALSSYAEAIADEAHLGSSGARGPG